MASDLERRAIELLAQIHKANGWDVLAADILTGGRFDVDMPLAISAIVAALRAAPAAPAAAGVPDEAAMISAFESHFDADSDDPAMEGELGIWEAAWRAALAARQSAGQKPVSGVVIRDGNPTLLQDRHINASDTRLYAAPVQEVPDMSPIAQRKLSDLQAQGYVVNGLALMRPGEHGLRVMIDSLGHVRWSLAEQAVPEDVRCDAAAEVAAAMREYLDQDVEPGFDVIEQWAERLAAQPQGEGVGRG